MRKLMRKTMIDNVYKFVDTLTIPKNNLLFVKLWGSRSHNTHLPHSDYDYLGVYAADTRQVLSLDPPKETLERADSPNKGEAPDYALHEVGKFCQLLLKSNPGILEMIFTDKFSIDTTLWRSLQSLAPKFLTKQAVKQYLGYVNGQMHRLRKGGYLHTKGGENSEKWMYHIGRLLLDCNRVSKGEPPLVWRDKGDELRFLMDIRNGVINQKDFEDSVQVMTNEVEFNLGQNLISDNPPKEELNQWLFNVRMHYLQENHPTG